MIFLLNFTRSFTGTNIPPFPLLRISDGPVGQLVEMTNFFNVKASSKTFGKPSNTEDKTRISALKCMEKDLKYQSIALRYYSIYCF